MADFENIVKTHAAEDGSIPTAAIQALVTAIKTAVGNEYVDKERYKAKLTEIDQLKEQQQTAEDNATTASKWKDKFDTLDKDFKAYKQKIAEEKALEAKKSVLRDIAKDAGLSEAGIAKALKYHDYSKLELDENGAAKEKAAILKGLKEEWPEYITTTETKGANTPTPPATAGKNRPTAEEILAIKDTKERQTAIAQNLDLFGGM
jgi:hypothetical protein